MRMRGFSYLEVLVAMFILAVAIVPAMQALQTGVSGAGIHRSLTMQRYALSSRMEQVLAQPYDSLVLAAKIATNETTASSYSDAVNTPDRVLVFLSLYDADADPFTLTDSNADGDNDVYTGQTADLLWVNVQLEHTGLSLKTLLTR